jgi:ATP-binding cassette subfamily F protein uup
VIEDFPGNYADYRMSQKDETSNPVTTNEKKDDILSSGTSQLSESKKRLSYKEKREFEMLEGEIAALREEKKNLELQLVGGHQNYQELEIITTRIGQIDILVDEKEMRWLELSEYSI